MPPLHAQDGLYVIDDVNPSCRLLLSVGPVRLHFSRSEFYYFTVLVLDAEAAFQARYCDHGQLLEGAESTDGFVLNEAKYTGKVYECGACSFIHVDAFDQRIVIAPSCFPYFLSLVRHCAAAIEQHFVLRTDSQIQEPSQ